MADKQARLSSTVDAFVTMLAAGVTSAAGDVRVAVITTDAAPFVAPEAGTYQSGERWMTAQTTDAEELVAAVSVGEDGDPNERPMDMIREALLDEAGAGGANAGFVRDPALLVIVLVTDEEDDLEAATQWGSADDPPDWVEAVASVKGGIRRNVVPLAIVPVGAQPTCSPDADAPRLAEFTEAFPRGAIHDVCNDEYATFLLGRIADLDAACDLYSPP
jgi:hypothetical protein